MTILLKSVTSTTTKSIPLMNSPRITALPSKKLTKGVALCSSTHVITSTVVRIFCQMQQFTKTYNQKHLKSSRVKQKNLISNLHGTCAVFLKNTLPDQPKPAVFYGIPKIHRLLVVIKTAMEYRNIITENVSNQTAIDIDIKHNILPPFRPIISGIGCLTENMSAYVEKFLQLFPPKIPGYIQDTTRFPNCISKIKTVPHNAFIVSMDVKTLYSSIPHSDGIKAYEISMMKNGFPYAEISSITKIIDLF